jgi:hypothetical protein
MFLNIETRRAANNENAGLSNNVDSAELKRRHELTHKNSSSLWYSLTVSLWSWF